MQAGEELRRKVKELSEQKTINHIFLEHVTGHVDSGLICYDDQHLVRFINHQAKKILNRKALLNVDNLQYRYRPIYEALVNPNQYKEKVVNYRNNGTVFALLVKSIHFSIKERTYTLVSFNDIKEQLDEREVDAWRNLVRYLSHEILNSVIPIANLSDFVKKQLVEDNKDSETNELIECLETVSHRSKGLVGVVNSARQLSHLPPPSIREFQIHKLLKRVLNLLNTKLEKRHILVKTDTRFSDLSISADFDLIEQVLINLLNNAMDALAEVEEPIIYLTYGLTQAKNKYLTVQDNGPGIPPNKLEEIFIPFYTTKKHGTGIGLSLSRQIMHLHKGALNVKSQPGKTTFTLEFKT